MKPSEEFMASPIRRELAVYASLVEWDISIGATEQSEDIDDCMARIERLIAEREKAARIEGMEASANALMREGYPVPACYLDTLIAEERAR